ncbi:uncharacterized protein LOC142331391 [Lycorma delicatula]|uniref:uncharacterized protein LOC142331391 n=1 Tax=Lycorma delicatula TaxID=130591 RepID=UPI003F516EC8
MRIPLLEISNFSTNDFLKLAKFVAYLSLIESLYFICTSIRKLYIISQVMQDFNDTGNITENWLFIFPMKKLENIKIELGVEIITYAFLLIAAIILLHAIHQNESNLMLPWIILKGLCTVLLTFRSVYHFISHVSIFTAADILYQFIWAIMWQIVYSHYSVVKLDGQS